MPDDNNCRLTDFPYACPPPLNCTLFMLSSTLDKQETCPAIPKCKNHTVVYLQTSSNVRVFTKKHH